MNVKKTESFVTKIGVYILFLLTFIGIIFYATFCWNMFGNTLELAGRVFIGTCFILAFSSVLVSSMLNISRIANSMEKIANKKNNE